MYVPRNEGSSKSGKRRSNNAVSYNFYYTSSLFLASILYGIAGYENFFFDYYFVDNDRSKIENENMNMWGNFTHVHPTPRLAELVIYGCRAVDISTLIRR